MLDDRLVREGLRRFKCRSKRELVELALTELPKSARRRDLLSLRGKVKWEGDIVEAIRRSVDCLIAATCLESGAEIYHNDRDFDSLARVSSLAIYRPV